MISPDISCACNRKGDGFMERIPFYHIEAIRSEYRRIEGRWLKAQYQLLIGLILFTVFTEVVMAFLLSGLGVLGVPADQYLVKYLLLPGIGHFSIGIVATGFMRSRLTDLQKAYVISMLTVLMAFWVYTVHSVFRSLFLIFTLPMLLTVLYGNQLLTGLVCIACILGKVFSDLVCMWDALRPSVLQDDISFINFLLSLLVLFLFYCVCYFLIVAERAKTDVSIRLEQERERLWEESMTDALTRVGNRQALREAFRAMEEEKERKVFYLAMMDLDDFKSLNDTYGHNRGDQYLRELGEVLRRVACDTVQPFRFGGDEFCVLFCGEEQERVQEICHRIQDTFLQSGIHRSCRAVSVSIGVAKYCPGEAPSQLLNRSDKALYNAKLEKGSICFC